MRKVGFGNSQARSHNSRHNAFPQNNFSHSTGLANFVSKELLNTFSLEDSNANLNPNFQKLGHYLQYESFQQYDYENQDHDTFDDLNQLSETNPCYEIDDQYFWRTASTNQSAT